MAYDGSGTFTVLYNWATEAGSPPIAISKLDAEMAGIATGLSSVYTKTLADARYGQLAAANTWTGAQTISAAVPYLLLSETGVTADNGKWALLANNEEFSVRAYDDALSGVAQPILIARTGTTVDSIALTGTAVTVNSIAITPTTGTFTAELATDSSGGSVLASGTAYYKKNGNLVTVRFPCLVAATTDTTLYIRGIPSACQPSLTGTYIQCVTAVGQVDGATSVVGLYIEEGVAYWPIAGIPVNFSSSNTNKGLGISGNYGTVITYQVGD